MSPHNEMVASKPWKDILRQGMTVETPKIQFVNNAAPYSIIQN